MQKSKETGYSFKINVGDRIFHLMATTESERMKWHQALKVSFATTKEINNPFKVPHSLIRRLYSIRTSIRFCSYMILSRVF
jgi:hypothetical protein